LKGPKGPQKTLAILERKGYLRKVPGSSRAIEIFKGSNPRTAPVQSRHRDSLYEVFAVPIVGTVRAGEPILAIENIEGYVSLDRSLVSSEDVFFSGSGG
jgi:repressor LexA